MIGSAADAEDAVQETIVRAWRSLDRFEGRASVRTWLHRIATNVCLDALSDASRRARPMEEGPSGSVDHVLEVRERTHWLEPIADARTIPADGDPHEIAVMRQSIRLAFVAALQQLPPRQRAALLLTEVVGWSAAEVAECLETSVAAVKGATFGCRPPYTLWLRGPESVRAWLWGPGIGCRGSQLIPVQASGSPAFAQYRPGETPGTYRAWALIVLELKDDRISGWNAFLDTERLFPMFGLPLDR
jgi:RNA polymerase sigma-70 factor (ECF subfamily)